MVVEIGKEKLKTLTKVVKIKIETPERLDLDPESK